VQEVKGVAVGGWLGGSSSAVRLACCHQQGAIALQQEAASLGPHVPPTHALISTKCLLTVWCQVHCSCKGWRGGCGMSVVYIKRKRNAAMCAHAHSIEQ
jgi:hypothetical protein